MLTKNILSVISHGMTPEQSRAARGWLDMSQQELAEASNVSLSTVRDFEKGRRVPIANNLNAIRSVLESRGIAFTEHGLTGPNVADPV